MQKIVFNNLKEVQNSLNREIGISSWRKITQEQINLFADATGDHQWIHVDQARALKESPFGETIAHGFLTLSLIASFFEECLINNFSTLAINYGLNKVRFPSPVRVNDRVRGRFFLLKIEEFPGELRLEWKVTIEIENQTKPACIAETLTRWYF